MGYQAQRRLLAIALLAVVAVGCNPASPEVITANKQAIVVNGAGQEETIDAALLNDEASTIQKVNVIDRHTKKELWITLDAWREDNTHTRYLLVQPK